MPKEIALRYGNNPHQRMARCYTPDSALQILNGSPSHINLLDILTGWQMTRDLFLLTGMTSAASLKHCTPVGLAIAGPLDEFSKSLLDIDSCGQSLSAYLRARSSDWSAAYGDVAVVFGEVDGEMARTMSRLVSDGMAATSFTKEAIEILSNKQAGRYLLVQLDPHFDPPKEETREIFGVRLMQDRNDYIPSTKDFRLIVGERQLLNEADLDLKLAIIAMKYSVSNNIVIAAGNRTFAISAGQQSRILSTKIACSKFRQFRLLQHPEVIKTTSMTRGKITDRIIKALEFSNTLEIQDHLYQIPPVLTSDGFIPFTDNIDEAKKHGIKIVLEPEGALKGKDVAEAASSSGITLVRTEKRYFYH